ncbi:MAG TPA: hypothetical protein VF031_06420 [Alphaproteobacteria bacterium]
MMTAGCAVKGYELGWRDPDRIAPLLGRPLDALGGCRYGEAVATAAAPCAGLAREIDALAAALPPIPAAPEALGARCGPDACSYGNAYQRRDLGVALVLPVFRKVVLREARARFVQRAGRWHLDSLAITDVAPPAYGPLRIGGPPLAD